MIPPALIEAVAREACKQMGLDADDKVEVLGDRVFFARHGNQRWTFFVDDARKAIAFARAVKLCDAEGKG